MATELKVIPGSIGAALLDGEQRLHYADVIRPRRHTELLLEAVLGVDRTELYLRSNEQLSAIQKQQYSELLFRRESGEPVQYIVGWAPFYGRRFRINKGVFIPRFETETVIEVLMQNLDTERFTDRDLRILDLCCGCGVIGLTAALEIPPAQITLVDNSDEALQCAELNAREMELKNRIEIIKLDVLDEFPTGWFDRFHFVVANPPYIPVCDFVSLPTDVRNGEPRVALTDDSDGLGFYKRWVDTVPSIIRKGGRLIVECGDYAADAVAEILSKALADIIITSDINGTKRVISGIGKDKQVDGLICP